MKNETLAKEKLIKHLPKLNLAFNEDALDKLLSFVALILRWNKVHNLTAISTVEEGVNKHLIDSLSINQFLVGQHIIDVGTGAGLPGIPLAIANPDKSFVLLDSSQKRQSFLRQAVYELGITNVNLVCSRVEDFYPEQLFSSVVTRAFASLTEMLNKTKHLCAKQGSFLAMKGKSPQDELESLSKELFNLEMYRLVVPADLGERHLVIVRAKGR